MQSGEACDCLYIWVLLHSSPFPLIPIWTIIGRLYFFLKNKKKGVHNPWQLPERHEFVQLLLTHIGLICWFDWVNWSLYLHTRYNAPSIPGPSVEKSTYTWAVNNASTVNSSCIGDVISCWSVTVSLKGSVFLAHCEVPANVVASAISVKGREVWN